MVSFSQLEHEPGFKKQNKTKTAQLVVCPDGMTLQDIQDVSYRHSVQILTKMLALVFKTGNETFHLVCFITAIMF